MTFWKTAWAVATGVMLAQLMSLLFALAVFGAIGGVMLAALHS